MDDEPVEFGEVPWAGKNPLPPPRRVLPNPLPPDTLGLPAAAEPPPLPPGHGLIASPRPTEFAVEKMPAWLVPAAEAAAAVITLGLFCATTGARYSIAAEWNYVWLYLTCWLGCAAALSRLRGNWKWKVPVAIVVSILASQVWQRFDTYRESWTSQSGSSFTDTYLRGDKLIYRMVRTTTGHDGDPFYEVEWLSGPMGGSGVPHGEWEDWKW
ncbi:MAG TPA: hypothetical protein VGL71_00845, partial [Urbifossiella sp.]